MRARWLWGAALVVYGAFLLWYDGWRGPLEAAEIEAHLATLERQSDAPDRERLAALRAFLESDDGHEFFMLNLIRLHPEPVEVPGADPMPADQALERYTGFFMPQLLARAGHPSFVGPVLGSYMDAWAVEPDPGWSVAGLVRYRSRRDMIELASDPRFGPAHAYKIAAMSHTLAFPVRPRLHLFGVRGAVALLLALAAALGQLALGRRRS